uniref:Carboxylic ester hydrolase n=2 Tax=Hippocampus comes TaxID=109280 RepID=A0A3Q3DQY9_HIPCM
MVEGKNIRLGFHRSMDIFKGIPFADVPETFEKPERHPGWEGVLKATEYKEICLQLKPLLPGTRGSDDCLYLNIWVPHGRTVSAELPVMVWLFGGAFLIGGSMGTNILDLATKLYDGQEIADRGNVIVVTLGYRVGTLGFLSTGDSLLPGNYGLWDQHAAIAWVHRNIRAFGGDPDNITIFGESAGGASVNFQILSPYNKGLIRRAISESGVALCPWSIIKDPRAFAEEVARKVNCPTDHKMAACLKTSDPVRLTEAGSFSLFSSPSAPLVENMILSAVIDGDFLPHEPCNLFHNAADVDYIAGINDMDGHILASGDIPSINLPFWETSIDDMKTLLQSFTKPKGEPGMKEAFSVYTSKWAPDPSKEEVKRTIVDIETDYVFLVPTQVALELHAASARSGRTYSYRFSEPSRLGGRVKPYPTWMGADHTEELQYLFGMPYREFLLYWPHDRKLSDYMIAYWTNFAKTGDPNKGNSEVPTTWPEFTKGRRYLDINHKMNASSVGRKMRKQYVNFWTVTLPNLPDV